MMGTHNENKYSISADKKLAIILIVIFLVVGVASLFNTGII